MKMPMIYQQNGAESVEFPTTMSWIPLGMGEWARVSRAVGPIPVDPSAAQGPPAPD